MRLYKRRSFRLAAPMIILVFCCGLLILIEAYFSLQLLTWYHVAMGWHDAGLLCRRRLESVSREEGFNARHRANVTKDTSVYQSPFLFHIAPGGKRIEGSFLRAMVNRTERGWQREYFECSEFQENYRPSEGICLWC